MEEYFRKVDLIIQSKIDKMPLERNTAEKYSVFLKQLGECLEESQNELRTLFNDFTKDKTLSESDINKLNNYNKESVKSFIDRFKN